MCACKSTKYALDILLFCALITFAWSQFYCISALHMYSGNSLKRPSMRPSCPARFRGFPAQASLNVQLHARVHVPHINIVRLHIQYIHICMYTFKCTSTCTSPYIHLHVYLHTHIASRCASTCTLHFHVHLHVHVNLNVHLHAHLNVHLHTHLYVDLHLFFTSHVTM